MPYLRDRTRVAACPAADIENPASMPRSCAHSIKIGTQKARFSGENRALKCSVGSCAELKATGSRTGRIYRARRSGARTGVRPKQCANRVSTLVDGAESGAGGLRRLGGPKVGGRRPSIRALRCSTDQSPVASSTPSMRLRFCTAAPEAPLPRLSSSAISRACCLSSPPKTKSRILLVPVRFSGSTAAT